MKHVWTIICKKSIIDSDTNLISIVDVIEQLQIGLPKKIMEENKTVNLPVNFEIISSWADFDRTIIKKGWVNVVVLDPKGNKLKNFESKFVMDKHYTNVRTRLKISGLPISIKGVYSFIVQFKDKENGKYQEIASVPLFIDIKEVEGGINNKIKK